jgi:hypothetical protein
MAVAADSAVREAARANGQASEIAGHVDVLIVPTMSRACGVAHATGLTRGPAGLVLGAAIPIVAPARTDTRSAHRVLRAGGPARRRDCGSGENEKRGDSGSESPAATAAA